MVSSLSRRYLDDKYAAGTVLDTTEKVGSFLKHKFVGRTNEVVYLACLDNKKKLLYCDILTEGTIDSAPITVRRIVEVAMRVAAASVVVAHNHPQGFALPSNDDIATTIKLRNALDAVSVQLLDHIIVAQDDFVSLADSGLLWGCRRAQPQISRSAEAIKKQRGLLPRCFFMCCCAGTEGRECEKG